MTILKHQAIEIARDLASSAPGTPYAIKPGYFSAELRDGDSFSRSLGIDCRHWVVTLEYVVPEDVILCSDEVLVLVTEASGKAALATLM